MLRRRQPHIALVSFISTADTSVTNVTQRDVFAAERSTRCAAKGGILHGGMYCFIAFGKVVPVLAFGFAI